MSEDLRLLDAAQMVVDEINDMLDHSRRPLLTAVQLREAAGSITANVEEAYGRKKGPERNQFFRYARGSAREARNRLRASFVTGRIPATRYWRVHNRITTICKILVRLESSDE